MAVRELVWANTCNTYTYKTNMSSIHNYTFNTHRYIQYIKIQYMVDGSKYTVVQTKYAERDMSLNYIPGLLKTNVAHHHATLAITW